MGASESPTQSPRSRQRCSVILKDFWVQSRIVYGEARKNAIAAARTAAPTGFHRTRHPRSVRSTWAIATTVSRTNGTYLLAAARPIIAPAIAESRVFGARARTSWTVASRTKSSARRFGSDTRWDVRTWNG